MHAGAFDTGYLKDLRVTVASKRLRTCIIACSTCYIFIFTPILAYFIWNNMMAAPIPLLKNGTACGRPSARLSFGMGFQQLSPPGPGASYGDTVLSAARKISAALLNGTALSAVYLRRFYHKM
ncbi:unnamed protein product [Ixodes persulcatus]